MAPQEKMFEKISQSAFGQVPAEPAERWMAHLPGLREKIARDNRLCREVQVPASIDMIEQHVAVAPPDGVPVWDIDPYAIDILRDPGRFYAGLRDRGPFVFFPRYAILACGRYHETRKVFSDWERFVSSRGVGMADFKLEKAWRPPSIILEADPPYHLKTRTVMARALSPRAVAALKQSFERAADQLVDDLLEKGTFDAVPDFAEVFPATVFPQAVGLTQIDIRRLVDYGAMVFNAVGPDNELRRTWLAKAPGIVPWITEQCRRERLAPHGFGAAIYAAADDGEISEDEAGMLVRSLLSAGVDTTVTSIGNAIWCLAQNPADYEKLRNDPSLARPAYEEVLRYTSPVQAFFRTANRDTEVAGIAIERDTKILCSLASANLDPDYWPEAARFDITRRPTGHLAFGVGIHGCVGQGIARAELDAVLTAVAKKVRAIHFAGEPVWRPGNSMRSLDRLPVRFLPL